MNIVAIKSILWFFAIILMALSFPIQVYLNSPLPSLFPYLVISVILVLTLVTESIKAPRLLRWNIKKPIELVITIFIILVVFQAGWQTLLNYVSVDQGISSIVIFILPVILFIYFRNAFTEREIHSIFFAVAIAGLIVGVYFAFESISKLLFGIVPDYAMRAHEYSIERMGQNMEESNRFRIALMRSMGLLEKHSLSAAWISIGCFAALAFLPQRAIPKRALVLSIYGLLLVIGLNFTGIVGFLLAVFLLEFRGHYVLRGVISRRSLLMLISCVSVFAAMLLIISAFIGFNLNQVIREFIEMQYDVVSGTQTFRGDGLGYFRAMLSDLASLPVTAILEFPPVVLIGDGFTGFGTLKGGDFGFIETLCRLGLPLFLVIFIGLISLIRRSHWQIKFLDVTENNNARYLQFASSVIVYLLFSEIHYTVWSAKSILPVCFLCLAIFSRYLPPPRRRNSKIVISSPVSAQYKSE